MSELEVDKVKEGAQILSYNFKTIKMKQKEVIEISRFMLKYAKVHLDDTKRTKEEKKK
jgi:predicted transcriptional regulator